MPENLNHPPRYPRVPPNPFTSPADHLIQGCDMELAPVRSTFEEQAANPTPEVASTAAATTTSTTTTYVAPYTPSLHRKPSSSGLIPSAPTTPPPLLDPTNAGGTGLKTWEGYQHCYPHQQQQQHLDPQYLLHQPNIYNHHNPWNGSWNGYSKGHNYSSSDLTHPYDTRPLVEGVTPPIMPRGWWNGGGGGRGNGMGRNGQQYMDNVRPWRPPEKKQKICGIGRFWFWLIVGGFVFVVVVAVAVGVGVGVGLSSPSKPTPSPTPTPTDTIPPPVATSAPSETMSCPTNNLTLYTVPDSQKKFLLLCGRDYHSDNGTQDLYSSPTDTLEECLKLCAMQEGCLGAGWGYGKTSDKPVCWLKGELGKHHSAPHWSFLMLDDGTLGGGG